MKELNISYIWAEYGVAIKAFLHSKVANHADVDDLLQEIMLKTHKNLDSLHEESSVKAWLFQIANRSIIDFYRKGGPSKSFDFEVVWEEDESGRVRQELATCIVPFIKALEPDEAKMLMAIDIHGQSQKEYAHEHGVAYSTLKSRVQKARERLREVFESCCEFSLDVNGQIIDYKERPGSDRKC